MRCSGIVLGLFSLVCCAYAGAPQWWQTFGDSAPHGPISCCRSLSANSTLLAVEHNTKNLFAFSLMTGTWEKVHTSLDQSKANLPSGGVSLADGCLFYGGSYGYENSQFTFIQPSGAWNQVPGMPEDVDPWLSASSRVSETVVAHVYPYLFIVGQSRFSLGAVFLARTTHTTLEASYKDLTFAKLSCDEELKSRTVELLWGVQDQHQLFVISIDDVTREWHFDRVAVTESGPLDLEDIGTPPDSLVAALEENDIGSTLLSTSGTVTAIYQPPALSSRNASPFLWIYYSAEDAWDILDVNLTLSPAPDECNFRDHTIFLSNQIGVTLICSSRRNASASPAVFTFDGETHAFVPFSLEPASPAPRMAAAFGILTLDGGLSIAIYAGGKSDGAILDDVWSLDTTTGSWAEAESRLPEPRAYGQTVVWQQKMYIIGGVPASALVASLDLWSSSWESSTPTIPEPDWAPATPLAFHAACLHDEATGEVYINGGYYSENAWVYRLSLSQMAWLEPLRLTVYPPVFQPPLISHSIISHRGSLFLIGGSLKDSNSYLESLFVKRGDSWWLAPTTLSGPPAPSVRESAASFVFGDSFCVFGGGSVLGAINSLDCFTQGGETIEEKSTELQSAPDPVVSPAWARAGDAVFFIGGCETEGPDDTIACRKTAVSALRQCPAGTRFTGKSCEVCPVGHFSTAGATSCALCPAGTFSDFVGQGECSGRCPSGTYSEKLGATNAKTCIPCQPGTYSDVSGSTKRDCLLCPPGTYSNTTGASSNESCLPCPVPELCGPGAITPSTTNRTVTLQSGYPEVPRLQDSVGDLIKNCITYGMIGLLGLVALVSLMLVLLCTGAHKTRLAQWLHRADFWPALVDRVDKVGLPLRNSSTLGGIVGLCFLVMVVSLLARNILDVIPTYNIKREQKLVEGIPPEALSLSNLMVRLTLISLAHHGPCLADNSTSECHPDASPVLDSGGNWEVSCSLLPDGACKWDMVLGLELLCNSHIQVNVGSDVTQVFNGGWWAQIRVDGNGNTILPMTYTQPILPSQESHHQVFRGERNTTLTMAMTFTNYTKDYSGLRKDHKEYQYWAFKQVCLVNSIRLATSLSLSLSLSLSYSENRHRGP
ncbi:putative member of the kelch motif protein family [Paratrimastix pyriformis]|uniref:Member of the kelch motif protein family n=1 Tax=Paratrimastix pyriformis TaxID=342808 RepID=A0ABQ8UT72_9EUKA|nr:putative member of the kelch motif protein family [Paratrimastix pyriformis]